jgi:hypothetical protein
MFKVLVLQASYSLPDERTAFLIKDRLSFMRFLGLELADPGPAAISSGLWRRTAGATSRRASINAVGNTRVAPARV